MSLLLLFHPAGAAANPEYIDVLGSHLDTVDVVGAYDPTHVLIGEIVGSYESTINVVGSYPTSTEDIVGSYTPTINIVGERD